MYTGEILKTLSGHQEGVNDIAWSSDGEFLASASDDKTVILWSVEQVRDLFVHIFSRFNALC